MPPIPEQHLFREHHRAQLKTLESVRIPRVTLSIAVMLILGTFMIAAFLGFTPWVQTTSGPGVVTALDPRDREQSINALVSGRIQEWYVRDGSRVKEGDPILRLVDNDPDLVQRLQAQMSAAERKYEAAKSAADTAVLNYDRQETLFNEGLSAERDLEQARIRVQQLRVSEEEALAGLNAAKVNLSRLSIQTVVAPRDGTIIRLNAGDTATFVREGQSIATFLPDEVTRAVEIYVDGRDIGLVYPGRKVRLQFEGWPVVQFSGWPSVAIGTFGGEVVFVDPSAQVSGRFRVMIIEDPNDSPWPDEAFIRFGAQARGWVLLDTVRLGYELWRQLNNFPPNFNPDAQQSMGSADAAAPGAGRHG